MDYQLTATDSIPLRHNSLTIVILLIAYLTVLVLGLVGNVLVIFVVLRMPKMKTATKYFILNLAIADLLVLIFCLLPGLIANIYVPWVMGSLLCKAVPYIQGVSVCASVYSLAAISADRLMAIGVPLRRQISKSVARRIIVLIWIWGAGLALPWLLYFDLSNTDRNDPSLFFCTENWPAQIYGNIYFIVVNLGLFYFFPLSFIFFCHFSIWLRIGRSRPVPVSSSVPQIELVRKRAKASVQKLVIVVVVGFAACWLPLYLVFVRIKIIPAQLGTMEEEMLDYALPIAQWLGAANSCVNPILYTFFNRSFRYTLHRLVGESCALKIPKNYPNSHRHQHQHSNQGLNVVGLSVKFQRSHPKNTQLKNSGRDGLNCGKFNLASLHHNNQKFAAMTRSVTYMEAMENPW